MPKENVAELCSYSNILWKIKLANNKTGYLAEAIYKHSVEGDIQLLLIAYSKM